MYSEQWNIVTNQFQYGTKLKKRKDVEIFQILPRTNPNINLVLA